MFSGLQEILSSRYNTILDNMSDGYAYFEVVYDNECKPTDFIIHQTNKACEELIGFDVSDVIGKRFLEIYPRYKYWFSNWFATFLYVREKGGDRRFSNLLTRQNKLISFSVFEENYNHFYTLFHEIAENKQELEKSEAIYKGLFNNLVSGLIYYKPIYDKANKPVDYKVIDVNPAYEKLTGFKRTDVVGKLATEIEPNITNLRSDLIESIGNVALTEQPNNMVHYSSRLNKWFNVTQYSPKIGYTASIITDITEAKHLEQALEKSESKYRALFENMALGHSYYQCIFDESGKPIDYIILDVNPAYEKIKKIDKSKIVGRKATEAFPSIKSSKVDWIGLFGEIASTGKVVSMEIFSDVSERWYSINYYSPQKGQVASVFSDITEHKKMEDELRKAKEKAEEGSIQKSEFISNMSHELRTPINVILSAIQLFDMYLKNDQIGNREKVERHLKSMRQNCLRLLKLANNLIDTTKIDARFYELSMSNYNIVSVIRDITLSVSEYAKGKNIDLVFNSDCDGKVISCDVDLIERIILNLLSNAIKFTKINGTIRVEVRDRGDSINIAVIDNGIGIASEKQKIIFERYRQASELLTREHEGSGIGLSLVKSFVEMHNGSIRVESEYGHGSEFIIELPIKEISITENVQNSSCYTSNSSNFIEKMNVEFSDIYNS